ncbi:28S ribosomal protein S30, mitochondrial [Halotydeus destructor]|nr:28S ribosomal protein S30, mitochondrial [Halotydeus destructor]
MLAGSNSVINLRTVSKIQLQLVRTKCRKPVPELGKTVYEYKNLPDPANPEFEKDEFLPRRLSYYPPGIGQHRVRNPFKPWWKVEGKPRLTLVPPEVEDEPEFTDTPQYPPITDFRIYDTEVEKKHKRLSWYESIKTIPTVDEKMMSIVGIRAGHPSVMLNGWSHVYNNLPLYQNITRTNLSRDALPKLYSDMNVSQYTNQILEHVLEAVRAHCLSDRRKQIAKNRNFLPLPFEARTGKLEIENLIEDISLLCTSLLAKDNPHLLSAQFDHNADIRSWWFTGNLPFPNQHPRYTSKKPTTVDQLMQYRDSSVLNIRMAEPLEPTGKIDHFHGSVNEEQLFNIDEYNYHPVKLGYTLKWNQPMSVAGYWHDSDVHDFPFLSFYSRYGLRLREIAAQSSFPDEDESSEAMGMLSSFAWLNSLAVNHGFTPYQELTYPFTTQNIVTDGQNWNFMVYQLNSHSFHGDFGRSNVANECWSTGNMKLFEEYKDDKFYGINEEVVKNLIKFFLRRPQPFSEAVKLRPYLEHDFRSQEAKDETRYKLKRRYGQYRSATENYMIQRAKVAGWEYILGDRNPNNYSVVHMRHAPKYKTELKVDRTKFTV